MTRTVRQPAEIATKGHGPAVEFDRPGSPQLIRRTREQQLGGQKSAVQEHVRLIALRHPTSRTRPVGEVVTLADHHLEPRLPWLQLRDLAVNLRTPKRMGWMLDPTGRATGTPVVPFALSAR